MPYGEAKIKIKKTYRFSQETLDAIDAIAVRECTSATEAVASAVAAYADNTAETDIGSDGAGAALDALVAQLAAKDGQITEKDRQIAALTAQLSDTTAALRAAQALHAADVKRLDAPSSDPDAWKAKGLWARIMKR